MREILLGASHITDIQGLDHMLFLVVLAARYDLTKLGRMALLATAFTIGHSITLLLSGLNVVRANISWIEFLIPVTIFIMAILQVKGVRLNPVSHNEKVRNSVYGLTILFGLIHGLGFSSFFRIIAVRGDGIVLPLLKFNLGVELGQIVILLVTLSLFSIGRAFGASERDQQLFIGGTTFGLSALMIVENWPL